MRVLLDELETLLFVVWYARLEQNWVGPELSIDKRHVAVDAHEEVDTFVSLVEVPFFDRERLRATGAAERPPRRHLWKEEEKLNFTK